jgi:hypothetical protein
MGLRQIFDDGTEANFDGNGDPVSYVDTSGRTYTYDNSALTSFFSGALGTINAALRQRYVTQPAIQAQQQAAAFNSSQLVGIAALGLGGFLLLKLVKG